MTFLSLIEQREHSHERPLGLLFDRRMHAVAGVRPAAPPGTDAPTPPSGAVCYVAFDFHAVCGKLAFRNLPALTRVCLAPLREAGFFHDERARQTGAPPAPPPVLTGRVSSLLPY